MSTSLISIILVIVSSVIGAVGGFMFKQSTKNLKFKIIALMKNKELIFGFILFALAAIIYIIALTGGELNVLYPISALTYIWSTIMAKYYLKEKINTLKWSGIVLIIIGSIFIVN